MMGENEMGYGDYYNYDNSWPVAPPDYGAGLDPSCQYRQPEEDYRYGTYAVSLAPYNMTSRVGRAVTFACPTPIARPPVAEYHRARNPSAAPSQPSRAFEPLIGLETLFADSRATDHLR
ncbi:hypothetical protein RR48_07518 [Papilio machaon]|uniref:Uncharacterized protein n=1 Tax=Papilio machaon TaxID=76193 RepID=A0A194RQA8_PAPMA|nr:hypothetical protein RR48_07518 [Papilio machaon]